MVLAVNSAECWLICTIIYYCTTPFCFLNTFSKQKFFLKYVLFNMRIRILLLFLIAILIFINTEYWKF
uniref:7TM_GPCR_Srx domain-containing protein n=1 Tax=Heterorhabditis bacteriophora TaxID=37862 RepID=A0A1I7X2Z2_HETBA